MFSRSVVLVSLYFEVVTKTKVCRIGQQMGLENPKTFFQGIFTFIYITVKVIKGGGFLKYL